ncbi:MAG: GGDEF domain-containing protein [Geminicoccaceae bacterium]|nr:MAG: GGDEF domain-containing protein [Geminicoccaceae bacterium]
MTHAGIVVANGLFIGCMLLASLHLRRMVPSHIAVDVLAWAFAAALTTTGLILLIPWLSPVATALLVPAAAFATYACLWSAIWLRCGAPPPWAMIGAIGLGIALLIAWSGLAPAASGQRLAGMSALTSLGFLAATWRLARGPVPLVARPMDRLAAVFFGALGLAMAGRSGLALIPAAGAEVAWVFTLIVFPSLFSAGGLCLVLGYVGHSLSTNRALATLDHLTGVDNRRGFEARVQAELAAAASAGRPSTLVIVDIDGLKAINDGLGHPTGDTVIQTVAATLRTAAGAADRLGRLGGDEFALFMPGRTAPEAVARLEQVQAALAADAALGVPAGPARVSFGVAECRPDQPADYGTLYAAADVDLLARRARLRGVA